MAVERRGYLYVLATTGDAKKPEDYRMDVYRPDGSFLVTVTEGQPSPAAKIAVDYFRNAYCLTYRSFQGPGGRTEPVVSELVPQQLS